MKKKILLCLLLVLPLFFMFWYVKAESAEETARRLYNQDNQGKDNPESWESWVKRQNQNLKEERSRESASGSDGDNVEYDEENEAYYQYIKNEAKYYSDDVGEKTDQKETLGEQEWNQWWQSNCDPNDYGCQKQAGYPSWEWELWDSEMTTPLNLTDLSDYAVKVSCWELPKWYICCDGWYSVSADIWCDGVVVTPDKDKCKWIKLNTNFPIVWDCITTWGKTDATRAFPTMIWALTKIAMALIFVVCFIMIIVAWIMWAWAWEDAWKAKKAKDLIFKVWIAILLLWFSWVILRLINPNFFG